MATVTKRTHGGNLQKATENGFFLQKATLQWQKATTGTFKLHHRASQHVNRENMSARRNLNLHPLFRMPKIGHFSDWSSASLEERTDELRSQFVRLCLHLDEPGQLTKEARLPKLEAKLESFKWVRDNIDRPALEEFKSVSRTEDDINANAIKSLEDRFDRQVVRLNGIDSILADVQRDVREVMRLLKGRYCVVAHHQMLHQVSAPLCFPSKCHCLDRLYVPQLW